MRFVAIDDITISLRHHTILNLSHSKEEISETRDFSIEIDIAKVLRLCLFLVCTHLAQSFGFEFLTLAHITLTSESSRTNIRLVTRQTEKNTLLAFNAWVVDCVQDFFVAILSITRWTLDYKAIIHAAQVQTIDVEPVEAGLSLNLSCHTIALGCAGLFIDLILCNLDHALIVT